MTKRIADFVRSFIFAHTSSKLPKMNQSELSVLLVEALRRRNALSDIIAQYCIDTLRECEHCHCLMQEGWLYEGAETYCSDSCLMAEHPEEDLTSLSIHACDDDSTSYWTAWEG